MTVLKDRIKQGIKATGPITISEYMTCCLFDPDSGYYMQQNPFGVEGDFTTAPEISQLFGELVAIWLYSSWHAAGSPSPAILCEIGPGRGTMMNDIIRVLNAVDDRLCEKIQLVLVETSPHLQEVQKQNLADAAFPVEWEKEIPALDGVPLFIVGNELFDAIPVRQFMKSGNLWRERVVAINDEDDLTLALGANLLAAENVPDHLRLAVEGTVFEYSPQRTALMETVSNHIGKYGGAALFIDYGSIESASGDTLQAVRKHEYEDILANPGEADLTSHVDFSVLATIACGAGLSCHRATQSDFLLKMGLLERAGALGNGQSMEAQKTIADAVHRLAGPDAMGQLFKVLAAYHPTITERPFIADTAAAH